ncbi:MAG: glycosyltransferase [Bradymonadia bacterium]
MRYLFVVPPLHGHINPTLALGAELKQRGHECAWVGHGETLLDTLPKGTRIFDFVGQQDAKTDHTEPGATNRLRGLRAFKFLWESFFIPLAEAMLPAVEDAITQFKPDLIVSDQQTLAGMLAARRMGVRWVCSATTSAGVVNPFKDLPTIKSWFEQQMTDLQMRCELSAVAHPDRSPLGTLVFSSRALVGQAAETLPDNIYFVGPAIRPDSRQVVDFPWPQLRPGPKIFASLGTVNQGMGDHFFNTLFEAVADLDVQVIVVGPDHLAGPENVIVRQRVPQLKLLELVDAVICHGGHNTVCEALMQDLPLILTPIKDDQPIVAQQVVAAGAGIRLRFNRFNAATMRDAIERILMDTQLKSSAQRIGQSLRLAGGLSAAADHLETLSC